MQFNKNKHSLNQTKFDTNQVIRTPQRTIACNTQGNDSAAGQEQLSPALLCHCVMSRSGSALSVIHCVGTLLSCGCTFFPPIARATSFSFMVSNQKYAACNDCVEVWRRTTSTSLININMCAFAQQYVQIMHVQNVQISKDSWHFPHRHVITAQAIINQFFRKQTCVYMHHILSFFSKFLSVNLLFCKPE